MTSPTLTISRQRHDQPQSIPTPGRIISAVAAYYGVTVKQITSHERHKGLITARFAAMWLVRRKTLLSFEQIGQCFGDRDHASIMYAIRRFGERIARVPLVAAQAAALEEIVELDRIGGIEWELRKGL